MSGPVSVIVVGSSPWSDELTEDDLNVRTASALAERLGGRYDVIVPAGAADARELDCGRVRLFEVPARTRPGFLVAARSTVDRVARVEATGPRVLMSSDPLAALIVESARARRRLPHLFQVQGEIVRPGPEYGGWLKRRTIAAATSWAVRRSSGIRVVSESLRAAVEPMTGSRVTVIGSRVDTRLFAPRPPGRPVVGAAPGDRVDAVMVGSLVEVKNHETVIRAWARVVGKHPLARLMLIGDGHCRRRLMAMTDAFGLRANVRFRGAVPHRRVAELLTGATCLIHASWSEGRPRAVLEAMACGLPVLCSDIAAHKEIVPATAGHFVEPGDVAGWAAAVAGILDDPAGASLRGRRGRACVMERHDFKANIERYADFVRMVAVDGRGRESRP